MDRGKNAEAQVDGRLNKMSAAKYRTLGAVRKQSWHT